MDNPFLDSSAVLSEATLDPDPLVEDFMQELEQRKEKILQDVQQQQHLLESPAVSFSQKTLDDSQLAYVDADQSFMIQDVQGNTPATAAEQSAGIQATVLQQSQTASVAQDVLEEGFPERGRSRLPPLPTVEQTLTLEGSQPTLPTNIREFSYDRPGNMVAPVLFSPPKDLKELSPERLKRTGRLEAEQLRSDSMLEQPSLGREPSWFASSQQQAEMTSDNQKEQMNSSFKELNSLSEQSGREKSLPAIQNMDENQTREAAAALQRDFDRMVSSVAHDLDHRSELRNTANDEAHAETSFQSDQLAAEDAAIDRDFERLFAKHHLPSTADPLTSPQHVPIQLSPDAEPTCDFETSFRQEISPESPEHKPLVVGDFYDEARRSFEASQRMREELDTIKELEKRIGTLEVEKRGLLTKNNILENTLGRLQRQQARSDTLQSKADGFTMTDFSAPSTSIKSSLDSTERLRYEHQLTTLNSRFMVIERKLADSQFLVEHLTQERDLAHQQIRDLTRENDLLKSKFPSDKDDFLFLGEPKAAQTKLHEQSTSGLLEETRSKFKSAVDQSQFNSTIRPDHFVPSAPTRSINTDTSPRNHTKHVLSIDANDKDQLQKLKQQLKERFFGKDEARQRQQPFEPTWKPLSSYVEPDTSTLNAWNRVGEASLKDEPDRRRHASRNSREDQIRWTRSKSRDPKVLVKEKSVQLPSTYKKDLPFVVGKSTNPSFSLTANIQRVAALLKTHNAKTCNVCNGSLRYQPSRTNSNLANSLDVTSEDIETVIERLREDHVQLEKEYNHVLARYQQTPIVVASDARYWSSDGTTITPRDQMATQLRSLLNQMEEKTTQIRKLGDIHAAHRQIPYSLQSKSGLEERERRSQSRQEQGEYRASEMNDILRSPRIPSAGSAPVVTLPVAQDSSGRLSPYRSLASLSALRGAQRLQHNLVDAEDHVHAHAFGGQA